MTSGSDDAIVRKAIEHDLYAIKLLADAHRKELGFLRRQTLIESIRRGEVIVVQDGHALLGFVHYYHRRDSQTTLYNVVVQAGHRLQGFGKALVDALIVEARSLHKEEIVLKCPTELTANKFYLRLGFEHKCDERGKLRPLTVWRLSL